MRAEWWENLILEAGWVIEKISINGDDPYNSHIIGWKVIGRKDDLELIFVDNYLSNALKQLFNEINPSNCGLL